MNLRTCAASVRSFSTARVALNGPKKGLENYARVVDSIKKDASNDSKPKTSKMKLNLRQKKVTEGSYKQNRQSVGGQDEAHMPNKERVGRRLQFSNSAAFNDNMPSANFDTNSSSNQKFRKRRSGGFLDKKIVPKRYGSFKKDEDRTAPRKLFKGVSLNKVDKAATDDGLLTEYVTISENAQLQAALDSLNIEDKNVSKAFATLITSEGQQKATKMDTAKLFKDSFDLGKGSKFNTGVAKPAKDSADAQDLDYVVKNLVSNPSLNAEQVAAISDIVSGKTPLNSFKMKEEK